MSGWRLWLLGSCLLTVLVAAAVALYAPEGMASVAGFAWQRGLQEARSVFRALASIEAAVFFGILAGAFLIDLLALGYRDSALRNILHPDASTRSDLAIFLLDVLGLWRFIVAFSFLLIGYFLGGLASTALAFEWLHGFDSPLVQLAVYLIVLDFLDYWMHRTSHRLSWWWEVHKLHHSATRFNLVTTVRHHPLDIALGELFVAVPMAMIGVPLQDYFIVYLLKSVLGYLQHSMVPWRFGWLGKYVVMSPVDHRIHHSPYPVHWDKQFGHFLILWDRLFGTYYKGSFVNEKIGLSHTDDNRKGIVHDIVAGQLRFLRAFFLRKWSFREGVLTPTEAERIEAARNLSPR